MTLEFLPLFLGPMAIMALCAVPIVRPQHLIGWKAAAYGFIVAVIVVVGLRPLLPDLESARSLIATVVVGLGMPTCYFLGISIAERWSWRWTILLSASALALGLMHATTPAYAADPIAGVPALGADPLTALLMALASGQTPSWVTVILVAGLLLRQVNGIIAKGIDIKLRIEHGFDPAAPRVEIHHETRAAQAPPLSPDDASEERSGVRRRPR